VLKINNRITIPDNEVEIIAVRAQGPGGQNVNKVASAVHLRFNIHTSSLPDTYKRRLLAVNDRRVASDGTIVIKAQNQRTQERNRVEALARLLELIQGAIRGRKQRIPTAPSAGSRRQRLDSKLRRARLKKLRGVIPHYE